MQLYSHSPLLSIEYNTTMAGNKRYNYAMTYRQNKLVDQYIAQFPPDIRERLTLLRSIAQAALPNSIEDISYGMPAYRLEPKKRGVVFFGAAQDHIGIYGIFEPQYDRFMHEKMSHYRTGKGTLQFKNNVKFPTGTIRKILAFQAAQLAHPDTQPSRL